MRNKTEGEIKKERDFIISVAKSLYGNDIEILDTYFKDYQVSKRKNKGLAYLAKSIEYLADADVAVFAKGWENYRGCSIEHACAFWYGIKIYEV